VEKTAADPTLKQRLLNHPAPVLQERGVEIPVGCDVRVVDDPVTGPYLEITPGAGVTEPTADQLSSIAGGTGGAPTSEFTRSKYRPAQYSTARRRPVSTGRRAYAATLAAAARLRDRLAIAANA